MEISESVFSLVQLGGAEGFIRLCCGVSGMIGFIVGMAMICKALYLWSESVLGFSQGEKSWFMEGDFWNKIEEEQKKRIQAVTDGLGLANKRQALPSPEEMENNTEKSVLELLSKKQEKAARRRRAGRFHRSHFRSHFNFSLEVVNLQVEQEVIEVGENNGEELAAIFLTFLKEKAEKSPLASGIHSGSYPQNTPIAQVGAGIKTLALLYI